MFYVSVFVSDLLIIQIHMYHIFISISCIAMFFKWLPYQYNISGPQVADCFLND
jgi:hypothetical protein